MHFFLVSLVSLLLSFCHHSVHHAPETVAFGSTVPSPTLSFPDRRDLARSSGTTSYAEATCTSCLRMNTTYITR